MYTFSPNTVIESSKVNSNFADLADGVGWESNLFQGWKNPNATHSYSSWDSTNTTGLVTIPSGGLTIYSPGMRYRISQVTGGTKYFIITKVADTVLTIFGGTDYTLTNETVSNPFYSDSNSPFGFTLDPAKWTVSTDLTTTDTVTTIGQVASYQIALPIGAWEVKLKTTMTIVMSGANATTLQLGLSTSAASFTDKELTIFMRNPAVSSMTGSCTQTAQVSKQVNVAAATTYLYVGERTGATLTCRSECASLAGFIWAVCAYL